jgi:hypothetical protein
MQAQHDVGRVQLGPAIAARRHDLQNTHCGGCLNRSPQAGN